MRTSNKSAMGLGGFAVLGAVLAVGLWWEDHQIKTTTERVTAEVTRVWHEVDCDTSTDSEGRTTTDCDTSYYIGVLHADNTKEVFENRWSPLIWSKSVHEIQGFVQPGRRYTFTVYGSRGVFSRRNVRKVAAPTDIEVGGGSLGGAGAGNW